MNMTYCVCINQPNTSTVICVEALSNGQKLHISASIFLENYRPLHPYFHLFSPNLSKEIHK